MSQNNYTIRKAVLSDLDEIKTLADAHKTELGFILRPALAKSIHKDELLVVANSKGLIGFVDYHYRNDEQITLYNIVIAPKYRRQGIGSRLVQSLVNEAKEREKRHILLKCPAELDANKFYEALDFQLSKVEPGKHRKLNIWRWMF